MKNNGRILLLLYDLISSGLTLTIETIILYKFPRNVYFTGEFNINFKNRKIRKQNNSNFIRFNDIYNWINFLIKYINICKKKYYSLNIELICGIKNFYA